MRTQPAPQTSRFRTFCITTTAAAAILFGSGAHAAILVGTVVTPQTESIAEINQLIAAYNADFGASLPSVHYRLDKIEGQNSAEFEEGKLALSDFNFYHQDDAGGVSLDVFDTTVNFTPSTLGVADGFDSLDNPVFAFEQLSGPSFQYYVSKAGNLGWSLWAVMDGLNPAYTDAGIGPSSLTGTGFTRGPITDSSLEYDPIHQGVSHISFYSAPEPNSLMLLLVALAGLCGCRACRRNKS